MRAALVFEWRGAISGREEQGLEVLARATETWTKIAAEGRCEVPEVFVGIPKAMFIVRGEDAVLLELLHSEPVALLLDECSMVAEDFTYQFFDLAEAATRSLEIYARAAKEVGPLH